MSDETPSLTSDDFTARIATICDGFRDASETCDYDDDRIHTLQEVLTQEIRELGVAAVPACLAAIYGRDSDYEATKRICLVLGEWGTDQALCGLRAYANDPEVYVYHRTLAYWGLLPHLDQGLCDLMLSHLVNDWDEPNRELCEILASSFHPMIQEGLCSLLESGNTAEQVAVIEVYGFLEREEALSHLKGHLSHENIAVREAIVSQFGYANYSETSATLLAMLPVEDDGVRLEIIRTFSAFGLNPDLFDPLKALLCSPDERGDIRQEVAREFSSIVGADLALLPLLEELQCALDDSSSSDWDLVRSLADGLYRCGQEGRMALFDLLSTTNREEAHQRRFSEVAESSLRYADADELASFIGDKLRSEKKQERYWAMRILSIHYNPPSFVDELMPYFLEDLDGLRELAGQALLAVRSALPALVRHAEHPEAEIRKVVLSSIELHDAERRYTALVTPFLDMEECAPKAAKLLLYRGHFDPRAVELGVASSDHYTRELAYEMLKDTGASAPRVVLDLMIEGDRETRLRAAEMLARLGGDEVEQTLLVALDDPDEEVRWSVLRALGESGGARTVAHLLQRLPEANWETKARITRTLIAIGESAIAPLLEALPKSDDASQEKIVEALGCLDAEEAAGPILRLLFEGTKGTKKKAAKSLARIGLPMGREELVAVLRDLLNQDSSEEAQSSLLAFVKMIPEDDETGFLMDYIENHIRHSWPKEVSLHMMRQIKKARRAKL